MALKARVDIETALQNGRTILKHSFCDAPFKIADVTEDRRQKELRLMLMCSSPGVLDEDEYCFNVCIGGKSSLVLQTQSYQRIFQMKKGAVQNTNVHLGEGASLVYLPHPSVPHKASVFTARARIHLSKDCTLVWGEVISCGRKLNNEVFQFSSYHSVTEIFLNGRLAIKENLLLKPDEMNLGGIGQMEGFTHGATFICLNETVSVAEAMEKMVEALQPHEGITFGVSALPVNGFMVRLLGHKAEQLFDLLKSLHSILVNTNISSVPKSAAYV